MALSNRAPLARNPMRDSRDVELLMTSVPPVDGLAVAHIHGIFVGRMPLRTSSIGHWPATMGHLQCMHCGGQCNAGPPVPVARHYESQLDQYWVYGPFCRPCCAFGYICETDSTSKQLAPTAELLRRFFGLKQVQVAPPRASHWRFGGPLSDVDFYGSSGYTCLTTLQPPFVTFANYVVGHHQAAGQSGHTAHVLLPQSAGRLVGLDRPPERAVPMAEKRSSGKVPLILEFLATLKSSKDVRDQSESIDVKGKKRARDTEAPNFLRQYVKNTEAKV